VGEVAAVFFLEIKPAGDLEFVAWGIFWIAHERVQTVSE